jgi:hypothetical protein
MARPRASRAAEAKTVSVGLTVAVIEGLILLRGALAKGEFTTDGLNATAHVKQIKTSVVRMIHEQKIEWLQQQ